MSYYKRAVIKDFASADAFLGSRQQRKLDIRTKITRETPNTIGIFLGGRRLITYTLADATLLFCCGSRIWPSIKNRFNKYTHAHVFQKRGVLFCRTIEANPFIENFFEGMDVGHYKQRLSVASLNLLPEGLVSGPLTLKQRIALDFLQPLLNERS